MNNEVDYQIGIDVGTNSVGLAAIEIGADELPASILNSVVVVHDSGVDPNQEKTGVTRLAASGVARRARRMIRRRKRRLRALDDFLRENGYPLVDFAEYLDPHAPWMIRAELASQKVAKSDLPEMLSAAARHIARHRGWRSPYAKVSTLHLASAASDEFKALQDRVAEATGKTFSADVTPAQLLVEVIAKETKIRGSEGILQGKLRQSDYANELRKIAKMQEIDTDFLNRLIDKIFYAESPKGSAAKLVGRDDLPGQKRFPRAPKASLIFQKFRIISVAMNLRIADSETGEIRMLCRDELDRVVDFLMTASSEDGITWEDVCELLEIDRDQLSGTAAQSAEDDRPYLNPPVNVTNQRIRDSQIRILIDFWNEADEDVKNALIRALSNAEEKDDNEAGFSQVEDFLSSLDEGVLAKLETLNLPAGRAAYSEESMKRLNSRMLEYAEDLFTARKNEFGVADDWKPNPDPIGLPVGNPGVDRVLKIVNRWLMGIETRYGAPKSVNIEHIRGGFTSEVMARAYKNENDKRAERNRKVVEQIMQENGAPTRVRNSDIIRYLAVSRQNCQCAYCGTTITFSSCEMDHIVPRKGEGSTNTRDNLLAVCRGCNHSKGNQLFSTWVAKQQNPEISLAKAKERIHHWKQDAGYKPKQWSNFQKDVVSRLSRTQADDPIDARSIESVAWMARELAERVRGHYQKSGANTKVGVYRGAITAQARKASGLEKKVEMIGERGKTRLDRRHHAMDACVIALMKNYVAQTLAERISIRDAQRAAHDIETWKDYRGADLAHQMAYGKWLNSMNRLIVLFNEALRKDEIPVMESLRLRLGNSKAHDDTVKSFIGKRLGDAWSLAEIDKVSLPQMWTALTRCADFDPKTGLPENSERKIRVKDKWYEAKDSLTLFGSNSGALAVRGGYVEIGNTIHHARIYRINGKKPVYAMVRVFACDLARGREQDLFTCPLAENSISLRTADSKIRVALGNGTAEYLGWLAVGDELEIDLSNEKFASGMIGEFKTDFPMITRFRVNGFPENTRLRLRPVLLSAEGLNNSHSDGSKKVIKDGKWKPAVNVLFNNGNVRVIRRNALGEIRKKSHAHLPISWQV